MRRLTFETEPPSNVGSYKFLNQACDHRDVRGKGALQRKILPCDCLNKLRSGRRQTISARLLTVFASVDFRLSPLCCNGVGVGYRETPHRVHWKTRLPIPAGELSAIVTVTPIDDSEVEGDATVLLTLSEDALTPLLARAARRSRWATTTRRRGRVSG